MSEIVEHQNKSNGLYGADYTINGKHFLVAGDDRRVHVYDSMTRDKVASMH